ncbi:CobW family GTP-binding protein [Herpetosiphon geysericola]|uniref:Cobalamin biosynthesis protein P47K n=1 Tax=Herpetosiphon geysericola TaxID=70996 RepID=A0A0N8GR12_9CHLR|nr:GTP-binding protein [Herpetosiphon geysericola]KPL85210.1 cobalamin biosynthesis protein P47K [Herpetosiphon geysericola]
MSEATPIPMMILTGFLGAGKTTVLNRLLTAQHGLKIAVLVNDFGAINIDAQLVVGVEANEIVNLANGCICCTIREDLLSTTLELLERPDRPEYIIVEASGVSDPVSVALTFRLPALRSLINLAAIVAVVDAERIQEQRQQIVQVGDQIAAADIVVVNKIDLVDPTQQQRVINWIQAIVPRARILTAEYGGVPIDLLLGIGQYQIDLLVDRHEFAPQQHDEDWQTWHYQTAKPFTMSSLQHAFQQLPNSIFRAKGIVYLAEAPERQAIVQLAGKRASLQLGEPWGATPPHSKIVVIGRSQSFDPAQLTAQFDACLAQPTHELREEILTVAEWRRKYQNQ